MRRVGRFVISMTILFALCSLTQKAHAESVKRALLVGVSGYPVEMVGPGLQLEGPKHDVALMLETIVQMGFEDAQITILADGLDKTTATRAANAMPTRAAIMDGLADLAEKSRAGDFVLVFMSGHGSQQPDVDPAKRPIAKADDRDEIFLPIDIGKWEDSVGAVKNAIVDHEFGKAINAIRARGATVWVVIDACHSGTMTRSIGDEGMVKQVPPMQLGIPAAAFERARTLPRPKTSETRSVAATMTRNWVYGEARPRIATRSIGGGEGGYVAFFAAWPDQAARQERLPQGYSSDVVKKAHGVLTFYLAQAYRTGRSATFRDLAYGVMAGYAEIRGASPSPMFEGDIDLAFPGGGTQKRRYIARIEQGALSIDGGALDGINNGSLIAIAASDQPDRPKAYARIEVAGATRSTLTLVDYDGVTATLAALQREDLIVATLVEKGVDVTLRVRAPVLSATASAEEILAARVLEDLANDTGSGFAIAFIPTGESVDITLYLEAGRMWFASGSGELVKEGRKRAPSVNIVGKTRPEAMRETLIKALRGQARMRNLIRIAGKIGPGALSAQLDIDPFILRDTAHAQAGHAADDRTCEPQGRLPRDILPAAAVPLAKGGNAISLQPDVAHCDQLFFRMVNHGKNPIDITLLYIDNEGGIESHNPREGLRLDPNERARIAPVRILTRDLQTREPQTTGVERMLIIAVEAPGRAALPVDYSYLAQDAPRAASGATSPMTKLLDAGAFGAGTRNWSLPLIGAEAMFDFKFNVVVKDGGG